MNAGYSGTPLARKLSLKEGLRVWWQDVPESVRAEIEESRISLDLLANLEPPVDAAHIFVTARVRLEEALPRLLPLLAPSGFIGVSWPKKASKVATDISEDRIREVALPLGLSCEGLCRRCHMVGIKAHETTQGYCDTFALALQPLAKETGMVVCVCNAIRECDVRKAARSGASCPSSAYATLGRRARCGQCFPFAREVIASERATA